jgi:hypothetical protein
VNSNPQLDLFDYFNPPAAVLSADPPEAEPAPGLLLESLMVYASSKDVWASLTQRGATDHEIEEATADCYYPSSANIDAEALVPEVRALFNIPIETVEVAALPALELIRMAQDQCKAWLGSGRSPIHRRINKIIDARGEEFLREAGWPTHDGALYINAHTRGIESYASQADKWLDAAALKRGESRAGNVKYIVEHWTPLIAPAELLPEWEKRLAAAKLVKKPKGRKLRADWEPHELTEARKIVELLKAEIARGAAQ